MKKDNVIDFVKHFQKRNPFFELPDPNLNSDEKPSDELSTAIRSLIENLRQNKVVSLA